jgi:hypothetical protein
MRKGGTKSIRSSCAAARTDVFTARRGSAPHAHQRVGGRYHPVAGKHPQTIRRQLEDT